MSEVRDERHVLLAGATQIEDRQARLAVDLGEELLQTAAAASRGGLFAATA